MITDWTPELVGQIATRIRESLSACVGNKNPNVTWTIGLHEWEEGGVVRRKPDGSLRILIDIPPDRLGAPPVEWSEEKPRTEALQRAGLHEG